MIAVTTSTSSQTIHIDAAGQRIFPCRCGETHSGDYAFEDWNHHECLHECPVWDMGHDMVMCADCGKTWGIDRKETS